MSYLSSLRTYINLNNINDLNEDGITIRSIQFAQYNRPKVTKTTAVKSHTMPRLFTSFVVESPPHQTSAKIRPTQNIVDEKSSRLYTNVYTETKNIDIGELSFSNENATEDFLTDIMTNDISKLNFVCTPQKQRPTQANQQSGNVYENMYFNASDAKSQKPVKAKTPLHKARFVIIDENEYENVIDLQNDRHSVGLPELKSDNLFSRKPMYANQPVVFDGRYCDCKPNNNILKPQNTISYSNQSGPLSRPLRRMTQLPNQLEASNKNCPSPISFKKYLLQPNLSQHTTPVINNTQNNATPTIRKTTRISLSANNNFANFCITPFKANIKPDLLESTCDNSSQRNQIRTLSRFHKII